MPSAWETFNNSYIKQMKRPEYWGYNPDSAYGANMLFRSEETNPWANRDQSNAKFGPMGGAAGMTAPQAKIPGASQSGTAQGWQQLGFMPESWNLPIVPSRQKTVFNDLLGTAAGVGEKLATKSMTDKINEMLYGPSSFDKLSPMMQGYADMVTGGESGKDLYQAVLGGGESISESGLGGYDRLLERAVRESAEDLSESAAQSSVYGTMPIAGTALGLGKDLLSGRLFNDPGGSLGTAGGALAGAALGSAIFPGVGTALGSLLGGSGGGFLGRTIGRLF